MDTLTFLMLMMLVVLVVIVIQLRRGAGGGTCNCPVDQNWLDEYNAWHRDFGKWVMAQEAWDEEVYLWMQWVVTTITAKHEDVGGEDPPSPPCKFGSC
ncbi:MAG: hypothetical protein M8866_07995 [marine benthic group bacterium]|nr:hypothetical protein [Candidatus Benthicola marisminoris]